MHKNGLLDKVSFSVGSFDFKCCDLYIKRKVRQAADFKFTTLPLRNAYARSYGTLSETFFSFNSSLCSLLRTTVFWVGKGMGVDSGNSGWRWISCAFTSASDYGHKASSDKGNCRGLN